MIRGIVHFSLKFRGIVVALAALLLGYGVYVAAHSKLDVFPDFVPPQVTIQTEAPGFSPEDVEALVTRPLEAGINGLANQDSIRSESAQGLSVITVVFQEGAKVLEARQQLAEKLNETAGLLPVGVKTPKMSPLVSSTMDLLKIGLLSTNLSPMELRGYADWELKPRLLAVQGVARCNVFGGEVRQLQIQVHPEKLLALGIGISDVLNAARLSSGLRGGGFIETYNQRIVLQTQGQSITAEALANVLIAGTTNNLPVRMRDVALVTEGAEPKFGDALIGTTPGVLLTLSSQAGANTMEVTLAVEHVLEERKPDLAKAGITLVPALHRPATFIETSLRNIRHSLYAGAILVAIVLFAFLGHFRTAVISLTAIPLSLLTAIILMNKFAITLNTITLGGLAIAIGEVVDDAIIDVENIFRRLRENQTLPNPRPIFAVIMDASLEVRSAVVYATFVVALVFLPVLTLSGLQGSFFSPLAVSYILAIMASLGVALTVTPALCFLFFGKGVRSTSESALQRHSKAGYTRLLGFVAAWPRAIIALVVLLCVVVACSLIFLKGSFLPEFREGHFVLQVSSAPGTSLPETLRLGKSIAGRLLQIKSIATVEQQAGRAEQGEDTWGPHRSEFHVELKPVSGEEQEKVQAQIREVLENTPGIQFEVVTFLGDRISESISGETASVVVNLFGNDLNLLDSKAREIATILKSIEGSADVQVKSPPGAPRISIRLRPERVAELGFRPVEVLEAIQTAYQGTVVAQTYKANQFSDVVVILDESSREDPANIGSFLLRNPLGALWPLRELAYVYRDTTRSTILHEGARRRQTITCNPEGRDLKSFVSDARKRIQNKVALPKGFYTEFSGAAEQQEKATRELLFNSLIAAVGIVLLLSVVMQNWRNLLLVLANLPFALIGGILALHIGRLIGGEQIGLSMGSLVGFVTLFGITTRNSIMLISHYDHLIQVEGATWGLPTAIRGASERLVPILMTALVTGLGLLPLAIGSGEAGREIEGPMAIVILGGLITSTALNLLVLPTLAVRYGHFEEAAPLSQ
jgi:CzcA family heavy metal efflux pump